MDKPGIGWPHREKTPLCWSTGSVYLIRQVLLQDTLRLFRSRYKGRRGDHSRLAGYEDINDAVRVSADPTFRLLGSKKNWDRGGALTSRLQSLETGMLASEENLIGLIATNRELIAQTEAGDGSGRVVLEMDSTESPPARGQRLQRPLRVGVLKPSVAVQAKRRLSGRNTAARVRLQRRGLGRAAAARDRVAAGGGALATFRADAAFAKPETYEALEERGASYVILIPSNKNLELEIEDTLFRPPGRPSAKPLVRYKSFRYQAAAGRSRDGSSPSTMPASCFRALASW